MKGRLFTLCCICHLRKNIIPNATQHEPVFKAMNVSKSAIMGNYRNIVFQFYFYIIIIIYYYYYIIYEIIIFLYLY